MKYIAIFFVVLFLLSSSVAYAGKPVSPGKSKNFTPIPNSVCIDPGHGGSDIGTANLDLQEKNVNLAVAKLLQEGLIAAGYTDIFMTRTEDIYLSNADRYNFCDEQRAAILISIHHNGSSDPNTDYTTALYGKLADIPLAELVAQTVSTQLNLPNRGVSRFASGVLLKSNMPATISEGFFLTNTAEYSLIKTSGRLEAEADALFSAIVVYFTQ